MPALLVGVEPPGGEAAAIAAIAAPHLRMVPLDLAAALRRCAGLLELTLPEEAVESAAAALRAAGKRYYALSSQFAPRLPKPLQASTLDPRDPQRLLAQVALTGPPESLPWTSVLVALPAQVGAGGGGSSAGQDGGDGKPLAQQVMGVASSLAFTGGLSLLAGKGKKSDGDKARDRPTIEPTRSLLVLVAVRGPGEFVRLHTYADRCNYRVLPAPQPNAEANWRALLAALRARFPAGIAGAEALLAAESGQRGPLFADDAALVEHTRWLLALRVLQRLGHLRP